jgi:hypothetical protein
MIIKRSAAGEISRLVAQLSGGSEVACEAAVARLTILGTRAVEHLLDAWRGDLGPNARAAVLRALEAIGDRRALKPALSVLEEASAELPVALSAVGVLRGQLGARRAEDADRAFEALAAIALDRGRDERMRLAAIEALEDLPASTRRAVRDGLAGDPNPRIRARARAEAPPAPDLSPAALEQAAKNRLPDSPDQLRSLVTAHAATTPLPILHRLVEAIRARETAERGAARASWLVARAAVHQALAARQSTVALYDLRETLSASREPLPVGFLAALSQVGNASCLEPIAEAFASSKTAKEDWWRQHLITAFRDIVRRGGLSRRHAAVKRVASRWPQAAEQLMPPRR